VLAHPPISIGAAADPAGPITSSSSLAPPRIVRQTIVRAQPRGGAGARAWRGAEGSTMLDLEDVGGVPAERTRSGQSGGVMSGSTDPCPAGHDRHPVDHHG